MAKPASQAGICTTPAGAVATATGPAEWLGAATGAEAFASLRGQPAEAR